ncbi:F-box DNA helicase 1-like [Actinia tenebrosa]|uniref:F-box DNA helicase 1-like n=1 Tax=Actinia tenebrosa TaxID=6105 RepID=A0A6P8IV23_ACTTE|nr:F-box DNA helicase 1-like [Actinia tenebrosa]
MSFRGGQICGQLPVEILENIFCQVPFQDLMRNCAAVCKSWNDVINKPEFLYWKKMYHRLIMGCQKTRQKVQEIMDEEGLMKNPTDFTPKLCNFVKSFRSNNPLLLDALNSHSKYPLISCFYNSTSQSVRENPWSVILLLTIVSTTVQDITEIIWTMMSKTSNCLVIEIIELLYLLATMLWVMKSEARINSGLHYRIIYACHLFESSSTISQVSGYAGTSYELTHEQLAIIKHNIMPEEVIKIVAFAGTGKTTTLVEFTRANPNMKFLNVSFNKSIQQQAERIFPPNVKSRTSHSLAFRAYGCRYTRKLGTTLRSTDAQRVLADNTTFIHAERVVQTVNNFLASSRQYVTKEDITRSRFTSDDKKIEKYFNSDAYKSKLLKDAKTIWNKMKDVNDKDIYMTHDAVANILLSQRCSKILVGDPHQQIYSFRGAENAMESVKSSHTFYLTRSFRFGPEIAYVANSLLEVQKDYHGKTLIGNGKPGGIMGDTVGQLAIICRTNFGVFSEASRLCHHGNNLKVAFAGGLERYNLNRVLDIYHLHSGYGHDLIKDPFIKRFRTFKELLKFASDANDKELGGKIKIVEHFGSNVPIYIKSINNNVIEDASQADYIVSTAHKAKGLQFSSVRVHDDFALTNPSMISTTVTEADIRDENNLLYVAVTRAQNRLILNQTIVRALQLNKEHLLQPVTGGSYDGGSISCKFCYNPVILDHVPSLLVEQPKHTIYNKNNREEKGQGFVCCLCALEKVPHLYCFLNPPVD